MSDCMIDNCPNEARARNLCPAHLLRQKNGADMDKPLRRWRSLEPGEWRLNKKGYVVRRSAPNENGKRTTESQHRTVMEGLLGRKLSTEEEVHHRNTIRNDNRPENLQVWLVGKQPRGGTVEDMLAWAREIVATYGGTELDK